MPIKKQLENKRCHLSGLGDVSNSLNDNNNNHHHHHLHRTMIIIIMIIIILILITIRNLRRSITRN